MMDSDTAVAQAFEAVIPGHKERKVPVIVGVLHRVFGQREFTRDDAYHALHNKGVKTCKDSLKGHLSSAVHRGFLKSTPVKQVAVYRVAE